MKQKTRKQPKPNIVRTRHHNCAYVRPMLSSRQSSVFIMLSILGQGAL